MFNSAYPQSLFEGCKIRGLPIASPFKVQYETACKENQVGTFIIVPLQFIGPATELYDLTTAPDNTHGKKTVTIGELEQTESYMETHKEVDNLGGNESNFTQADSHEQFKTKTKQSLKNSLLLKGAMTDTSIQPTPVIPLNEQHLAPRDITENNEATSIDKMQNKFYISGKSVHDYYIPCDLETVNKEDLSNGQKVKESESDESDLNETVDTSTDTVQKQIIIKTEPQEDAYDSSDNYNSFSAKDTEFKSNEPEDSSFFGTSTDEEGGPTPVNLVLNKSHPDRKKGKTSVKLKSLLPKCSTGSKTTNRKRKQKEEVVEEPRKIKNWLDVRLEEHQDKYREELLDSMARKDRGKSEAERMVKVYACTVCHKFKSECEEGIEKHLEDHLSGKLTCKYCKFIAGSLSELYEHRKKKHTAGNYKICPQCGIQLRSSRAVKDHLGAVHKNPQYECVYCVRKTGETNKFSTDLELRKHLKENHKDCGFLCKQCERLFFCKALLENHEMSCTASKSDGHCCQKCGAKFSCTYYLTEHVNTVHLKVRRHHCTECPFATFTRGRLQRHMLSHTRVRPYSCSECDFTCVQSYQLTSHMRTHTGDKPFKCTQCKYAAAWNVQLKEHVKVHDIPTSVVCENCDIVFKNEKTLNMHRKKQQCMS